jgi:hypothetical protein
VYGILFLFQVYNPKHFNQLSVGAQAFARTFPKGQSRPMDRDVVASPPKCRPRKSNKPKKMCADLKICDTFFCLYTVEERAYLL